LRGGGSTIIEKKIVIKKELLIIYVLKEKPTHIRRRYSQTSGEGPILIFY
jgi:hypothetical protein